MCPVRCERGVWVSEIREHTISLSSRHHHQAQGWAISIGGSRAENQKYSQCPWFWHFLAILNFLVISRPKLKFNNTFFRTDLALEFWKSMKDFRDFFSDWPTLWWQKLKKKIFPRPRCQMPNLKYLKWEAMIRNERQEKVKSIFYSWRWYVKIVTGPLITATQCQAGAVIQCSDCQGVTARAANKGPRSFHSWYSARKRP